MTGVSQQPAVEQGQRTPVGTINVVDPNPLNWLFITWRCQKRARGSNQQSQRIRVPLLAAPVSEEKVEFYRRYAALFVALFAYSYMYLPVHVYYSS